MNSRCRTIVVCSLLFCSPLLASCTKNVSRVETGRLSRENPTAYVFAASTPVAHDRIVEVLSAGDAPDAVFGERKVLGDDTQYADHFSVEDALDPASARTS